MRALKARPKRGCTFWTRGTSSRLYTPRERAALEWTDALTLIAETHAPDQAYEAVKAHFSPKEIVDLTMLIGTINAWNRMAISLRYVHPEDSKHAAAA